MKCFFSPIVCKLIFIFGATMDSNAAVSILLSGNPNSPTVDFSTSGSGVFRSTGSSRLLGTTSLDVDAFSSRGSRFDSRLDHSFAVSAVAILTNTTTFQSVSLLAIILEDEGAPGSAGDDIALLFSDELSFTTGDSYTISGAGSIDLGAAGFGFNNLNLGSGTGPLGLSSLDVDGLKLNIVPEPSHCILSLVGFGALLMRRRK